VSGRAVAHVPRDAITLEELRALGWGVDDLEIEMHIPFRDFGSLEEAKAAAERALPRGATISWNDDTLIGGFVVGHDGIGPPLGGHLPAYVLLRDGTERFVETREQRDEAEREPLAGKFLRIWRDGVREGIAARRAAGG